MPIRLNTKSVYYKTPTKFVPIGKFDYSQYNHQSLGIEDAQPGQAVGVEETSGGKPTSFCARPYFYNMEISIVNSGNAIINGVYARVYAGDDSGPVYAEILQTNSTPVEISVPTGFAYYIQVYDPDLLCIDYAEPVTGLVVDHDITVVLQCTTDVSLSSAQDIKNALNAGEDLSEYVGTSITCMRGEQELEWDIVDYDASVSGVSPAKVTLMMHDLFPYAIKYDMPQALMWCENGLAAGNYKYFAYGDSQFSYLTLTQPVPAGGQLLATKSEFATYASLDATQTIETGEVNKTELPNATSLGYSDKDLLNAYSRTVYGSNNYGESGVFKWLNSSASNINSDATRVTKLSRPFNINKEGFLYGLDENFVNVLDNTAWKCSGNNHYECPQALGGLCSSKSSTYTVTAKVGIASQIEIFGSYSGIDDGSTQFDLYVNASASDRIKYELGKNTARYWWLRSPYPNSSYSVCQVGSTGNASNGAPIYTAYLAPVVCISADN